MKLRILGALILTSSVLALASCGSSDSGPEVDCTSSTPTFAANVRPLFISSGCTASGCHSGVSPQGGMNLASGDVYTAARARVSTSSPGGSELLKNPTGEDGHQTVWATSDTAYETTYCWIENGALNN